MANIASISNSVFDSILPTYGSPRIHQPIWDASRKMFIKDEHESLAGNRSYNGIRVSDKLIQVETIGHSHTWTWLNAVELFVFDYEERVSIGQESFPQATHHSSQLVREASERILKNYLKSQCYMSHQQITEEQVEALIKEMLDRCYCDILDEKSSKMLEIAKPLLRCA